ncbi:MAG: DEAD/DEAH box helicase [Turneriella sp.]|nr:DEAD/DEAH box helicase [Turneriella sp.]
MSDFQKFEFNPLIAKNIERAGFKAPTPIQREAIPHVLAGHDILGLAQTGTGKTAAFVLPTLQRLLTGARSKTPNGAGGNPTQRTAVARALVIAPTRELAEQINEVFVALGKDLKLRSVTIYGGASMNRQLGELRRGVDIIVACPGRLLDHLQRKTVSLAAVETLVLDEADQMFDMGFFPAIRQIVAQLPAARQTLLFSATMPDEIRKLAAQVLKNPVKVELERGPVSTISHALYPVAQELKTALLLRLLQDTGSAPILVFTKTKHKAKRVADQLTRAGFSSASLQGNLSQNKRDQAMSGFRSGKFQVLVATDIAARGIDVNNISHIINYDIPATAETYIHRIGRTGRAEKSGEAYTLVTGEDKRIVRDIEKSLGKPIEKRMLADFDYKKGGATQVTIESAPPQNQKPPQAGENSRPKSAGKPRRKRFRGFGRNNAR